MSRPTRYRRRLVRRLERGAYCGDYYGQNVYVSTSPYWRYEYVIAGAFGYANTLEDVRAGIRRELIERGRRLRD